MSSFAFNSRIARSRTWAGLSLLASIAIVILLVGCATSETLPSLYVDGTRGCKEDAHPVALWSQPGAVPAGAEVMGTLPHGVQVVPQETASAYGIKYYLVSWEGQAGWLPAIYTETIEPVCE